MRACRYLTLLLCCMGPLAAQAEDVMDTEQLAVQLFKTLRETPESLRWVMPDEQQPKSHVEVGVAPIGCSFPVPAPLLANDLPRLLMRCSSSALIDSRLARIHTVTSWTHADGGWRPGQIISLHIPSRGFRTDYGPTPSTVWHSGPQTDLYARAYSVMSLDQARQLQTLWMSYSFDGEIAAPLEQWRQLPWAAGVLGLKTDGGVLLQKGSLAGVGILIERMADGGALPPTVTGVIRAVSGHEGLPGKPLFLLQEFEAGEALYAVALTDVPPENAPAQMQVLRSEPHYSLVLVSIERKL